MTRTPGRSPAGVGFIQLVLALAVILIVTVVALRMYQRSAPPVRGGGHPARAVLDRVELRIEGIASETDALQATEALRRVPGVAGAAVDARTGVARVTFHPGRTNRDRLVAGVEQAGYRVAP